MKSKQITVNDVEITVHSNGSISKPNNRFNDKRVQRTFGYKCGKGYMKVNAGGKTSKMHRIVAQAFLSDFLNYPQVDHIDGDRTNNDISNLRMATNASNRQAHMTKIEGCSSQYRGVCWCKRRKKWRAKCEINGNIKHIGGFDDEHEAAIARDAYAFSRGAPLEGLNFPENYA